MKQVFVKNLNELEHWLEVNADTSDSIWLEHYKFSSGLTDLTRDNLVNTLLCFGWVDSLPGKVDDDKTKIRISPRNPKSAWSKINKDKVARLISEVRMRKRGLELVKIAKQNGAWDKLNEVDKLIVPEDMQQYLKEHNLQDAWESLPKSKKRGYLEFLLNRKSKSARIKYLDSILK